MSELKAIRSGEIYNIIEYEDCYRTDDLYYPKSEADAVIAELEESHKKEVEQLLMEIVKLKEKRDTAEKLLNKALDCVSNGKNHMMSLARKKNHADYKRCLAMSSLWRERAETSTDRDNTLISNRRCDKWLAIAEKFKEAN